MCNNDLRCTVVCFCSLLSNSNIVVAVILKQTRINQTKFRGNLRFINFVILKQTRINQTKFRENLRFCIFRRTKQLLSRKCLGLKPTLWWPETPDLEFDALWGTCCLKSGELVYEKRLQSFVIKCIQFKSVWSHVSLYVVNYISQVVSQVFDSIKWPTVLVQLARSKATWPFNRSATKRHSVWPQRWGLCNWAQF